MHFKRCVCASVIYTIKNGSFAQDVTIAGHFDPADYGFPAESQIQVFTEVYDDIQPAQIERTIPDQHAVTARHPDRTDHLLDFGKFVLGTGRAHRMTAGVIGTNLDSPVTKEFRIIDGRRFIIESLEIAPILDVLQALPSCNQSAELRLKSKFKNATIGYASIPRVHSTRDMAKVEVKQPSALGEMSSESSKVQVALGLPDASGLVIDYLATLDSTMHPTLFQSDVTYFVSGPVYCNGPVTLEAACFKFPYCSGSSDPSLPSAIAYISINNGITCKTAEYFPGFFDETRFTTISTQVPQFGEGFAGLFDDWMAGLKLQTCMELFHNLRVPWKGASQWEISGCRDLKRVDPW